jgi:NhaP-type Na+/H+ and K+/H+ antiporter
LLSQQWSPLGQHIESRHGDGEGEPGFEIRPHPMTDLPEMAAVPVKELKLPAEARAVCYHREGRFALANEETTLQKGDEVVRLTDSKNMPALQERWQPKPALEESAELSRRQPRVS